MPARIKPGASDALIVVDVQNCFVPGGTLAVAHGEEVVPVINRIAPAVQNIIVTLFVSGLATDFCIQWTALDARKLGFETYVIEDACRGIDIHGSVAAAWKAMADAGVVRIRSSDVT